MFFVGRFNTQGRRSAGHCAPISCALFQLLSGLWGCAVPTVRALLRSAEPGGAESVSCCEARRFWSHWSWGRRLIGPPN